MLNTENLQNYYLQQLGITRWRLRDVAASVEPQGIETHENGNMLDISALKACVARCTACDLHKTRTQTVFGTGSLSARVMFIGEAPGAEEDRQGKPFVGRAGQLLTEMLKAIGLSREEVYIANVLKCRPPHNRDPVQQEVAECSGFLQQQIDFIQPKLLVALGRISAHYLLACQTPLSRLRGQLFAYGRTKAPLLVTYHPAYLLRSPADKAKAYQDLLAIKKYIEEKIDAEAA